MVSAPNLLLLAEHEELRASVRGFLERTTPQSVVRELMETTAGFDPATWQRGSTELGLAALLIPENLNGAGYSFVEVGVVLEESGRTLFPSPLFATVLATTALLHSHDADAQQRYLPTIASGELCATVALPSREFNSNSGITATWSGDAWRLSGSVNYVIDGLTAELILVVAETTAGPTMFAVSGTATGLEREGLSTMDLTRKLARLILTGVTAEPIGTPGGAAAVLDQIGYAASVGLAAEQVGGAGKVLELTVDYAKTRTQFGRAIGSFQAVKHRCADMLVEVESARSVMVSALWAVADGSHELPELAAMAKSFCSEAFLSCAGAAIQLHGGIGFTWEHPAHLYFKRAKSSALMFGDPIHHRRVLGDRLGL